MKTARQLPFIIGALIALAACTLPPVDVELSVALAAAGQMNLVQSFSLSQGTLQDVDPEARQIQFYPSLVNTLPPGPGGPLGFFVIERGGWVSTSLVLLDAGFLPYEQLRESTAITPAEANPFHAIHTLRIPGSNEEKLGVFRYMPTSEDYRAIAIVTDNLGAGSVHKSDGLGSELYGSPLVAAGGYAAAFPPVAGTTRFAGLSRTTDILETRRFGTTVLPPPDFAAPDPSVATAQFPAGQSGFGRLLVAEVGINTVSYASFPIDNRYRTFVHVTGQPTYTELAIAGRLETLLSTGQILTRTRDRFVISSRAGKPRSSFAAGSLQFAHERDIAGIWHTVFTLSYWGRVDGSDRLFVKVYTVRSDRLGGIR